MRKALLSVCAVLMGSQLLSTAHAQAVPVGADHSEYATPKAEIAALTAGALGERVSLYTGETEFLATDIDIPGNNRLPVRFSRRLRRSMSGLAWPNQVTQWMGDWEIDIPYLYGTFAANLGWQVSTPGAPNNRCSVDVSDYLKATPPLAYGNGQGFGFSSAEYWSGNSLHVPGQEDQRMLVLTPDSKYGQSGTGYRWTTSDSWIFSCLPALANGGAGEGFLAKSPDGIMYKFDWMARSATGTTLRKTASNGSVTLASDLARYQYFLLPTEMSDRFGNWVRFTYGTTNNLTSITSSDGRNITLTFGQGDIPFGSGVVTSVTDGARVWTYTYESQGGSLFLKETALPDQSKWQYGIKYPKISYGMAAVTCADPPQPSFYIPPQSSYVIHPSGLRGDFYFTGRMAGRSYTPRQCVTDGQGNSYILDLKSNPGISISRKDLSGPGISGTYRWDYSYGPQNESYDTECGACLTTSQLTVSEPENTWTRYTFNNRFGAAEGRVLVEETGKGSVILRKKSTVYNEASNQIFPRLYGKDPCLRCNATYEVAVPELSQTIEQDGMKFTRKVDGYDKYARPVQVTKKTETVAP